MTPVGFEHTISAGERPHTYALERAANGPAFLRRMNPYVLNILGMLLYRAKGGFARCDLLTRVCPVL